MRLPTTLLAIVCVAPLGLALPACEPPPPVELSQAELDHLMRFGSRQPKAKAPGTVRVATYNVENLFDGIDDPSLSGRNEDMDDATPPERLVEIAVALKKLDADVVALQEIESLDALKSFRDIYLKDLGYDHLVSIDAGDERGIEQAVLSRFPITASKNWVGKTLGGVHPEKWGRNENWYAGKPIAFHRSPLRVDVQVPAGARGNEQPYDFTLFVVHHKSGGEGDYWREAEARGLAEIVTGIQKNEPDRNLLILGEFNAEADARSVKTYLDMGFTDLFGQDKPSDQIISHESDRRIDLILYSPTITPELVLNSRFVMGTPARLAQMSWRDPPPPGYASDHYPVVVDLVPVEK